MSEYTPKAKELSIKSRRDDALIVGSEIRNALQEQQDRIEQLEAVVACHICCPQPSLCSKHAALKTALEKTDE